MHAPRKFSILCKIWMKLSDFFNLFKYRKTQTWEPKNLAFMSHLTTSWTSCSRRRGYWFHVRLRIHTGNLIRIQCCYVASRSSPKNIFGIWLRFLLLSSFFMVHFLRQANCNKFISSNCCSLHLCGMRQWTRLLKKNQKKLQQNEFVATPLSKTPAPFTSNFRQRAKKLENLNKKSWKISRKTLKLSRNFILKGLPC